MTEAKELYCEERALYLLRKGYNLDEAYKKAEKEWDSKYELKEKVKMTYTP